MYDYEEEVGTQVTANLNKIGLRVVLPLYLVFNFFDWLTFPAQGLRLLGIRLLILPAVLICLTAIRKQWSGPWHALTVWICGLTVSLQMIGMAVLTGGFSGSVYIHSINLIATLLIFLFPLRFWQNLTTLAVVYLPPIFLLITKLAAAGADRAMFSTLSLYASMMITLAVASSVVDKLRFKTFQQKAGLFYMATTDSLSGLKLRRYFFNRFIQELSLRLRKNAQLTMSVVLMDIDGFKQINDTYGHDAGDRTIRHIGELIRSNIRIYDIACRFGGEEFVILLPETTMEEAKIVSDRIRTTLEASPVNLSNREIKVTMSVGISGTEAPVTEEIRSALIEPQHKFFLIKHMTRVIKEADDALYEAKKKGKNCVASGGKIDFVREISEEDIAILKSYLPYFEQSLFMFQPEAGDFETQPEVDFNFYPEEYFFRRCVEGLYRWYRDPEWHEVLAVISIHHPNSELIKRQFSKIFRLADAISVLGKGVYGVIFYGMPEAALSKVAERIQRQLASVKIENAVITIAAAPLCFEGERQTLKSPMVYADFSKRTSEIYRFLKRRRFASDEIIFYCDPAKK